MDNKRYLFFFSYASINQKLSPTEFERFKNSLKSEVIQRTQITGEDVYVDKSEISIGDKWEPNLLNGLQTSRVLVCLCSTKYFQSDYCGLEYNFFQQRINTWKKAHPQSGTPPLIIPVLWDVGPGVTDQPTLSELQYDKDNMPEDYLNMGLRTLMMTSTTKNYNRVVVNIATRIAEVIEKHEEMPQLKTLPPPKALAKAFKFPASVMNATAHSTGASAGKRAGFIIAVGSKHEFTNESSWDGYGNDPLDWKPYFPNTDDSIWQIAARAATEEGIPPVWIETNKDAGEMAHAVQTGIKEHSDMSNVVVILVDPCSLNLDYIRIAMEKADKFVWGNVGIIAVKNERLPEISINCPKLNTTFPNNIQSRLTREYHDDVISADELQNRLANLLVRLRSFVLNGPDRSSNRLSTNNTDQMPSL